MQKIIVSDSSTRMETFECYQLQFTVVTLEVCLAVDVSKVHQQSSRLNGEESKI